MALKNQKSLTLGPRILCALDFDGTITEKDVVDQLLAQFARGPAWVQAEKDWAQGKISSAVCLEKQLACVDIQKEDLDRFLQNVRVDKGFVELIGWLEARKIPVVILSDGFDLFIGRILEREGLKRISYRANHLDYRQNKLVPVFPHIKKSCGRCGHCKATSLKELGRNIDHIIFIGDGLSDICALQDAHTVFAKGKLAEECASRKKSFHAYKTLKDVFKKMPQVIEEIMECFHEIRDERYCFNC